MTTIDPSVSRPDTAAHWSAETYRLLDAGDPRAFGNFASDISVQIANNPVAHGIEQTAMAFRPIMEAAPRMQHNTRAIHDLSDDESAIEADVTYFRRDGITVSIPVTTFVTKNQAGQFSELRLYFDPAPVYAGQQAHIELEGSVSVTPDGDKEELRERLWAALVDKAHNATAYVPNITACEVVDSGPGWILRDIILDGRPTQERVTFESRRRILFTRTRSDMLGTVENFLEDNADGSLNLRFRFDLRCVEIAEGTALAEEIRAGMQEGYRLAFTAVGENLRTGALTVALRKGF